MRSHLTAFLLLALSVLALTNCSSDSPTSPGDPTGDEVLAESYVDAAGDTLAADDGTVVEIPGGAFAEGYDLRLVREREPVVIGDTETYRLEGLPADFAEPVTFRLTAAGVEKAAAPEIYLQLTGVVAPGDTSRYFAALPAESTDLDEWVATLDPGDYLLPAEATGKDVEAIILDLILTGVRQTARSHVDIPLPIYITGNARQIPYHQELLLGWLVEDAERFMPLSEGFRQTLHPSRAPYMPMVDAVLHFSHYEYAKVDGFLQRSESSTGAVVPHLEVTYNPEDADLEELRRHLHFHFWRMVYEARTGLPVDWWLYATLYALQRDVQEEPPAFLKPYATRVLRGVARSVVEEDDPWTMGMAPYGYGMQLLAGWIDEREGAGWGREALGATVNERAGYGYLDVGHLVDALPGDALDWWPAFLSDLLEGNAGPIDLTSFLALVEDTWVVDESQGPAYTFRGDQYLLDGNLYRVDLEQEEFEAEASLRLAVTDPRGSTELVVFSVGDGLVVPLGRGRVVDVDHLDRLSALDDDLLVLTANAAVDGEPRTPRTIEVSAILDEGLGMPDVTTFTEVGIEVTTDITYSDGLTHQNKHLHVIADVSWRGDGLYVSDDGGATAGSDTFAVRIDPATLTLGDWYASSINHPYSFEDVLVRLAGASVPLAEWGVDDWGTEYVRWTVYGDEEVCSRLTTVHYVQWYDDVVNRVLAEYDCHETGALYDTSSISVVALRRTQ